MYTGAGRRSTRDRSAFDEDDDAFRLSDTIEAFKFLFEGLRNVYGFSVDLHFVGDDRVVICHFMPEINELTPIRQSFQADPCPYFDAALTFGGCSTEQEVVKITTSNIVSPPKVFLAVRQNTLFCVFRHTGDGDEFATHIFPCHIGSLSIHFNSPKKKLKENPLSWKY